MFGTLVLGLPSAQRGGELVIRHAGRQAIVDLSSAEVSELAFAAFYADCEHEVRPIAEGNRVCLIYNLVQRRARKASVSHILFAGHAGFRQFLEKTDDNESTFSPSHSHSESHSIPTASGSAASGSRFDALRLCVFALERRRFQRRDAEAQRPREDLAKRWLFGSVGSARSPRTGARDF